MDRFGSRIAVVLPSVRSSLYGIEIYSLNKETCRKFVERVLLFPRSMGGFHQSGSHDDSSNYHLFEFWGNMNYEVQTMLLEVAEKMAEEFVLPFQIG